jgi:hypothetical protein
VKVIFDREALVEMREAAAFYEDCQRGLGRSFLDTVEVALAEIQKQPLMWRKVKGRFRRYLVQRFPYGLIYAVQEDVIYIAAPSYGNATWPWDCCHHICCLLFRNKEEASLKHITVSELCSLSTHNLQFLNMVSTIDL